MSRSRSGRRRSPARAARSRPREARTRYRTLTPAQMDEARGYLIEAIEAQITEYTQEAVELRRRRDAGDVPAAELADVDQKIDDCEWGQGGLGEMLESVRAGRRFTAPGGLALGAIRGRRFRIIDAAVKAGRHPSAEDLEECRRREQMIAQYLMDYEPTSK